MPDVAELRGGLGQVGALLELGDLYQEETVSCHDAVVQQVAVSRLLVSMRSGLMAAFAGALIAPSGGADTSGSGDSGKHPHGQHHGAGSRPQRHSMRVRNVQGKPELSRSAALMREIEEHPQAPTASAPPAIWRWAVMSERQLWDFCVGSQILTGRFGEEAFARVWAKVSPRHAYLAGLPLPKFVEALVRLFALRYCVAAEATSDTENVAESSSSSNPRGWREHQQHDHPPGPPLLTLTERLYYALHAHGIAAAAVATPSAPPASAASASSPPSSSPPASAPPASAPPASVPAADAGVQEPVKLGNVRAGQQMLKSLRPSHGADVDAIRQMYEPRLGRLVEHFARIAKAPPGPDFLERGSFSMSSTSSFSAALGLFGDALSAPSGPSLSLSQLVHMCRVLGLVDSYGRGFALIVGTAVAVSAFVGDDELQPLGLDDIFEVFVAACEERSRDGLIPLHLRLEAFLVNDVLRAAMTRSDIGNLFF